VKENGAKAKLKRGEFVTAITINPISGALTEQAGLLGFDCVVADGEHGAVNDETLEDMARAAELVGATCGIRMASAFPVVAFSRRYLDAGISMVQVTQIQSAEQARQVVEAVKYPPMGKRGVGPNARALEFGAVMTRGSAQDFTNFANENTMVIVSIEDQPGLDAVEEIVAVDGIDIVMPGEFDLSTCLGYPGQVTHPVVERALDRIHNRTLAAGKVLGRGAHTPADIERVKAMGAQFSLTSVAKMISLGATPLIKHVQSAAVA
jgi:4-hydroxy-2-oxoheptanedioate aldolase